jgi:ABC-2 type transport system permease protein
MKKLFRGFGAIFFKECIVILRDPTTLFFMFVPPLIQMIAFGFALDNDVKHMALVVYDEDHTVESRQFVERLENTETFRVVREVTGVGALTDFIRRGKAYAGLHIPPGFTRERQAGRNAQVQMLIDGSNSTTALQALNTALGVAFRESLGVLIGESGRKDLPVEVRPQMLYNPAMRSPNFFIPGVMGLMLQIATVFATAMSIVREREKGTLEQLMVSPVSPWGLMFGKLVPYLGIGLGMAGFLFFIMRYVFQIPIMGSMVALFASALVYVFTLLSIGLLISTKAENQMQALQISMTLILPSVFFSGFIFPRETMPGIFYAIGAVLPTTYYIDLMRAIILRGAGWADFWPSFSVLCVMAVVLFTACASRFRRQLA